MDPLYPENPQLVKTIAFVIENWRFLLTVLGLSVMGLGWYWRDIREQP